MLYSQAVFTQQPLKYSSRKELTATRTERASSEDHSDDSESISCSEESSPKFPDAKDIKLIKALSNKGTRPEATDQILCELKLNPGANKPLATQQSGRSIYKSASPQKTREGSRPTVKDQDENCQSNSNTPQDNSWSDEKE